MIATTARSLSHNPVRLSVLLLPVMRLVFKTTDGVVEPGSTRADGSDVSVASTHGFETGTQVSSGLLEGMLVATSPLKSSGSNVVV